MIIRFKQPLVNYRFVFLFKQSFDSSTVSSRDQTLLWSNVMYIINVAVHNDLFVCVIGREFILRITYLNPYLVHLLLISVFWSFLHFIISFIFQSYLISFLLRFLYFYEMGLLHDWLYRYAKLGANHALRCLWNISLYFYLRTWRKKSYSSKESLMRQSIFVTIVR